ncbi:hypothetical protein BCR44DRAFT_1403253 [Catenaria anguillulae PL171]|uniref:TmcB/TmcC TPR repeats domain-containing protein n=1 Tax=Catenaria anguillulae PL171 TaxID=765915 RepID=A0A1Y2HJ04_9FUNG|nr:hypothetical protein BCR44DRAFT_1403253 [Catenaria anguillulae PL171]
MYMAAACAMLCSMLVRGLVGFDTQSWWFALIPSSILGLGLGFGLSRACSRRFLQRTIRTWHRILREEAALANFGKMNGAETSTAPVSVTVSTLSRTAAGGAGKSGRPHSLASPTRSSLAIPTVEESDKVLTTLLKGSSIDALNAVQERSPPKLTNVFSDPLQVELCIRFIRQNPSPKQIAIGLQLLERGLAEFPKDAMLHLLAATYMLSFYGPQGEKVADALMRELDTSRHAIPIDVKFLAWCREKAMQSQGVRVLDQTLDILKREARFHHLQALTGVRDMWEAVRTGASFERMAQITAKLAMHQQAASGCYKRLLARSQEDQAALRMYAQFLHVVEADSVRAQQILDLADGAEERQSRRNSNVHGAAVSDVTGHHSGVYAGNALPEVPSNEPMGAAEARSVTDDASSSADDRVKHAFRGMKRAASQHGSQTSGSSTSRVARQRIMSRRFMLDRLTKPLQSTWLTFGCLMLFLAALVIGFLLILNFMGITSQKLAVEFKATRSGRRSAFGIFEGFRHMVYGNTVADQAQWQRGFNQLRTSFNDLITYFLPILNQIETTISDSMPKYRLFSRIIINGTRSDYTPLNLNNIQITNLVSQAGALAMTYNQFGQLTNEVFNSLPELRFVSDNLIQIIEGCKYLPNAGIQVYLETAKSVNVMLYVAMSLSLVFLLIFGAVTQIKVLRAYFRKEEQVQKILMALPKRLASSLLVDVDEELESFREITGADDLPEADGGKGTGATDRDQASGATANGSSSGGSAVGKARAMRYSLLLALALALVGGIVVTLFTVTLNALDVSKSTERLIESTHRRQYSTVMRIIGREFVSPPDSNGEWTLPTSAILPYMRTLLSEADALHTKLMTDKEGLNALLPTLAIMPRNCSLPTACAAFPESPEIGFTKAVLSLPLNTQYSRILEVGRDLVNEWLDVSARTTFRSSPAFKKWKLLEAISMDLIQRLSALDDAFSDLIIADNYASMKYIIVIFVALMVVTLVSFVAFVVLGIRRLDREAAVLVMLLHSIPPASLKEAPEVSRFIETGGLMLMM